MQGVEGRGLWTHDRNISNRYMLSTSDETGGGGRSCSFPVQDTEGQSIAVQGRLELKGGVILVPGHRGRRRGLCTAYIYTGVRGWGTLVLFPLSKKVHASLEFGADIPW